MRKLIITALVFLIVVAFGLVIYSLYNWLWGSDYHYRAAEAALARRDFAQAEAHLALCLEANPKNADAHLLAARTARRGMRAILPGGIEGMSHTLKAGTTRSGGSLDQSDKIEQHLKQYQKLGGVADLAQLERLLLRAQVGDLDAPAVQNSPASVNSVLVSWTQENHPETTLILEALITGYLAAYRMSEALGALNQWLEREDDLQARLWRGWIWERLHNPEKSQEDYQRALEMDDNQDEARMHLADLLLNSAKPQEALPHYQRLRERQPGNPEVILSLSRCLRDLGKTEEQHKLLDELLLGHPRNVPALIDRGNLALDEKEPKEAEGFFQQALTLAPFDEQACLGMCRCQERLGNKAKAGEYRKKAEKIREDLTLMDEISRKVMDSPRDPALRCEAGEIMLRNGQKEAGLRWLQSALKEDPRHGPTHAALAKHYEAEGLKDLAERHRQFARQAGVDVK